ncbi:MAG: hypothetical protein U0Q04_01470 [Microbacterium sp.]
MVATIAPTRVRLAARGESDSLCRTVLEPDLTTGGGEAADRQGDHEDHRGKDDGELRRRRSLLAPGTGARGRRWARRLMRR